MEVANYQLQVPLRPDIEQLFPDLQRVNDTMGVVRHDLGATKLLRSLGVDAPSPVLSQYDFPHPPGKPPFAVQKETVCLLTENLRAYVLSTMGVGKTACALWAFDYLRRVGQANKMLVVATLSTLKFTWAREVFEFLGANRCAVVYGPRAKRLQELARQDVDIYIINHDGVATIASALEKRPDIDVLCLDEMAVYRNPSDRSKLMQKLAPRFKWVWGMTGSPTPQAPTDVWGQARIVTPHTVPKYFTRFRDQLMVKVTTFKYMPRPNAAELAYAALQPSVRFTLEDVQELPPYVSRRIDVDLGPTQKKIYDEIHRHCFTLLGNQTITAVNAGAVLNKLLQISLGYVYANDGTVVTLDNKPRLEALLDLIDAATGKVIVFTAFKHAMEGILKAVQDDGWDATSVSGDTSEGKRAEIFRDFQFTSKYRVLVAHPQCMAHGITMTAADTVIWFGPITSLEIYDQANARIRRVGQKQKQSFLHLQATAAERKMYTLLINKQNVQSEILALFSGEE